MPSSGVLGFVLKLLVFRSQSSYHASWTLEPRDDALMIPGEGEGIFLIFCWSSVETFWVASPIPGSCCMYVSGVLFLHFSISSSSGVCRFSYIISTIPTPTGHEVSAGAAFSRCYLYQWFIIYLCSFLPRPKLVEGVLYLALGSKDSLSSVIFGCPVSCSLYFL